MFLTTTQTEKIVQTYQKSIDELKQSQQSVGTIVAVRQDVIENLKKVFKDDPNITIDQETGGIRLKDKIFFNYDSDIISPYGKQYLNTFIPKYVSTLLTDKTRNNVSEIVVEGHTDNSGSYLYNLDLSQRRSFAVARYILSDEMPDFEGKQYLRNYLTSTGKSFSNLIYNGNKVDADGSRRVEFKFRLKEEQTMAEIQKVLTK